MPLPVPTSLSPSSMASFSECGLAFRFSAIDGLPDPPSPWTAKGTLVHRALERLHAEVPAGRRTPAAARALLHAAVPEVLDDEEHRDLDLGDRDELVADAEALVDNVFRLEDPNDVHAVGLELKLEGRVPGGPVLRGIIDRLDRLDDGSLVVVDYKTGRAPGIAHEKPRLAGVQVYAFLVEATFGVAPVRVELLHLREPVAISMRPSEASRAQLARRTTAMWDAVVQACEDDAFAPRPSGLCNVCAFRPRCPAFSHER